MIKGQMITADCQALLAQNPMLCALHLGDNLSFMSIQETDSINLIYCDILYGTGKDFMDYKDLYPIKEIIYEHYVPRILEMYRLLKNNGSIYLQMDYRIVHWVRCIMDDIFGYGNFQNEIVWNYSSGGASKKRYAKKHDVILFYTKSNNYTFNVQYEKSYMKHKYGFKKSKFYFDDIGQYTYVIRKDYITDISSIGSHSAERTGYATQKPKSLIEIFVKTSSNEGDTVADFYLGSGTTAVVCEELNRNFIGCDINDKAIQITKSRLGKKKMA